MNKTRDRHSSSAFIRWSSFVFELHARGQIPATRPSFPGDRLSIIENKDDPCAQMNIPQKTSESSLLHAAYRVRRIALGN